MDQVNISSLANYSAKVMNLYSEDRNTLFSYDELPFHVSMITIGIMVGCVLVVGLLMEVKRTGGNLRLVFVGRKREDGGDGGNEISGRRVIPGDSMFGNMNAN